VPAHDQRRQPGGGSTGNEPLRGWKLAGLAALGVIVVAIPLYAVKETRRRDLAGPPGVDAVTFVGREACVDCHQGAYEKWLGSDHDLAMAPADEQTVLGDFDEALFEHGGITSRFYRRDGRYFVHTEGPGGEMGEFEILYTFGVEPLQQYLVPFPGGRLQALSIAWDVERQRWFHLYPDQEIPPDDWLHWTRNAQNWNGMCAECHSTNLLKGYNHETQTFDTTWSEIDVSCEACHGPGSRHVAWAEIQPMARPEIEDYGLLIRAGGIDARQQVELCAPCHSRRTELGDYDHTRLDLLDNLLPALLRENLYHPDGQILDEVYVWGSFVQSKMYQNDVRCSDCHDVHDLGLVKPGNELCLQCHRADAYDAYDHHFHKKVHEGKPSDGALCVKCHMPEQAYMVIDDRADHSLRLPRPDLTLEIGVPNACTQSGCHDDKPVEWSADAYTKWYGRARKPHYGTILAAGRARTPEAHGQLVALAQNALYPAIVRATALAALAAYPHETTTAAMKRALADDEALVRHTAVDSLSVADPAELVSLVAPLLFDPVRAVRMRAVAQLAGVPPELMKPYQRDAFDEVLSEYLDAMEYSLDFSFAGMNLGNFHAAQGRPAEAERFYRAAIEVDDLFYPAKMNLAVLLSGRGKNREAELLLREVLEAYPERFEAGYSLGLLLVEMNRQAEAVEFLRRAAQGLPTASRIHYNLGLLLQQLGQDAEAAAALGDAVELEPGNLDYLYALADHYAKRGRLAEALAVAERMIAAHPDNPIGHELKALLEQAPRP
jgi:tetratricopeptide (TPR) repeat protein